MASVMSRGGGRRRRSMGEINMVPFIDVMLVLLIIFMVSAPLITTGVVDLPTVGKAKQMPTAVVKIEISAEGSLSVRKDAEEPTVVTDKTLVSTVKRLQGGNAEVPVILFGDKNVKYDAVVQVMKKLNAEGVQRVGLALKQGG
ncbi:biopolymer transporter ExbD [Ideonella livida]|uniref:Protein TolR n=1 Tax=Ideonella livida TaxID=2707176 RepID=A0A7C9THV5_9BURK|nr:biopolymer transporter ExbD [Ideonella livida]NDY90780.1 protein TolR [Ideonella livida]